MTGSRNTAAAGIPFTFKATSVPVIVSAAKNLFRADDFPANERFFAALTMTGNHPLMQVTFLTFLAYNYENAMHQIR